MVASKALFLAFISLTPTDALSASLKVTISAHSSIASRTFPSSESSEVGRCGMLLLFEWVGVFAGVVSENFKTCIVWIYLQALTFNLIYNL